MRGFGTSVFIQHPEWFEGTCFGCSSAYSTGFSAPNVSDVTVAHVSVANISVTHVSECFFAAHVTGCSVNMFWDVLRKPFETPRGTENSPYHECQRKVCQFPNRQS